MKFHNNARGFSEYLDNLPIGIFRSTLEGKFVFCNNHMAKIFGFDSVEELMNYPVIDLYWDKKDRGHFIQEIMKTGSAEEISLPFKTKQGQPIWCAKSARPIFDEDGIMIYLDGVIRDITQHIEGTDATLQLDEMVNSINDLVVILGLDGTLLDINHAGASLLGLRKTELIERSFSEFIVRKGQGLFPLFLSEIRNSGRKEAILTLLDSSNQEIIIEFYGFLVKRMAKKDHIRGIARDITEKVKAHSEALAKERFEGVLEMAGGVAHKMNQPLTVMNNLIKEVLSSFTEGSEGYERVKRIQSQLYKLNDIADKIKSINKYESMDYVEGIKIVDLDKAT